jgi:2-polyprenyl-6-methoxyphenol hydroxylase-like FAD-dependent oxidoreductase
MFETPRRVVRKGVRSALAVSEPRLRTVTMTNLVDSQAFRVIHRHDYHAVLLKEARKLNVEIRLGVSVENIDFAQTLVQLGNGKVLKGDVIVGADGMSNLWVFHPLGPRVEQHLNRVFGRSMVHDKK